MTEYSIHKLFKVFVYLENNVQRCKVVMVYEFNYTKLQDAAADSNKDLNVKCWTEFNKFRKAYWFYFYYQK